MHFVKKDQPRPTFLFLHIHVKCLSRDSSSVFVLQRERWTCVWPSGWAGWWLGEEGGGCSANRILQLYPDGTFYENKLPIKSSKCFESKTGLYSVLRCENYLGRGMFLELLELFYVRQMYHVAKNPRKDCCPSFEMWCFPRTCLKSACVVTGIWVKKGFLKQPGFIWYKTWLWTYWHTIILIGLDTQTNEYNCRFFLNLI